MDFIHSVSQSSTASIARWQNEYNTYTYYDAFYSSGGNLTRLQPVY